LNHLQFDRLTRSIARHGSRRDVLRRLAGVGLALGVSRLPGLAEAKKGRKRKGRKDKKAKPNAFGCLDVGDLCKSAAGCCSGICEGAKGKRTCQAHHAGTCDQREPGVCEAGNPADTLCNGEQCACVRTTGGSKFCATLFPPSDCADCTKDTDCEAQGFPEGTACVPYGGEFLCAGQCETGMACVAPCGTEPPQPTEE
jgi:hypothetical protein